MINQEEYEVLKGLDDKWKWISRDGFKGELNVYSVQPSRSCFKNWWFTNKWCGYSKIVPTDLFQFVQWEDEEPHFIPDLIKEYEKKKYRFRLDDLEVSDFVDISSGKSYTVFSLLVEEGEEMKKDKKWLKDEVVRIYGTRDYWSVDDLRDEILDLINELDEPEVLSQDLPVIPKFVADWWERDVDLVTMYGGLRVKKKHKFDLVSKFHDKGLGDDLSRVEDWIDENDSAFLDLVNGKHYKVEKEKLYLVSSDENSSGFWFLCKDNDGEILIGTNEDYFKAGWKELKLTEKEIKGYDENYFPFAVPVENKEDER